MITSSKTLPPDPLGEMLEAVTGWKVIDVTPDPLPDLIANLLSMEGMHSDTALLIRMAVEAQATGTMPEFPTVALDLK